MKKIWAFTTRYRLQRIGLIFLLLGLCSLFSWINCHESYGFYLEDYNNAIKLNFNFPDHYDNWFYHLFKWCIPLGLIMWSYPLWRPIIRWINSGQ